MKKMDDFSNFNFLIPLHKQELFEHLRKAESLARTDFTECGRELIRSALELFINSVFYKEKINRQDIPNSLEDKIEYLTEKKLLPEKLKNKKVNFIRNDGKVAKSKNCYDYMRWLGNSCSHAEYNNNQPKPCFSNLSLGLKCFHELLTEYYRKQIKAQKISVSSFDEDRMPIGRYYIQKAFVPEDKERSQCDKEFHGYYYDTRGIKKYAILRQYDKENIDENFVLRYADVFFEASDESEYGILKGFPRYETVVGIDDKASSFYIYVQEFGSIEPKPLRNGLLKRLSVKQRIQLCKKIAECFSALHNLSMPIYHRLLTHDSIMICESDRQVIPYVSKFDFGKLTLVDRETVMKYRISSDIKPGTISKQAYEAKEEMKNEMILKKYLADEWKSCVEGERIDWEKVDIYSLGVLFGCIIVVDLNASEFPETKLIEYNEDEQISNECFGLICGMINDNVEERLNIDSVLSGLAKELD